MAEEPTEQRSQPFDEIYIRAREMEASGASPEAIDAFMRNATYVVIARIDAGEFGEPAPLDTQSDQI